MINTKEKKGNSVSYFSVILLPRILYFSFVIVLALLGFLSYNLYQETFRTKITYPQITFKPEKIEPGIQASLNKFLFNTFGSFDTLGENIYNNVSSFSQNIMKVIGENTAQQIDALSETFSAQVLHAFFDVFKVIILFFGSAVASSITAFWSTGQIFILSFILQSAGFSMYWFGEWLTTKSRILGILGIPLQYISFPLRKLETNLSKVEGQYIFGVIFVITWIWYCWDHFSKSMKDIQ